MLKGVRTVVTGADERFRTDYMNDENEDEVEIEKDWDADIDWGARLSVRGNTTYANGEAVLWIKRGLEQEQRKN